MPCHAGLLCPADRIVNTIGGFSTALGNACKCDPWAVEIFAEEVVRGGPAFAISLVISGVEPRLRQLAELGAWQVGTAVCAADVVYCLACMHMCGTGALGGRQHFVCRQMAGLGACRAAAEAQQAVMRCVLRVTLCPAGDQPAPGDGHC